MKCKRCGNEMKRQKIDNRKYRYYCPVCKYTIGQKEEITPDTSEYEKAYNIVMGKQE